MIRLDPLALKKLRRFKSIRRGYWSLVALVVMLALACVAELLVNHRALVVRYEGELYFPTYAGFIPGTEFDLGYAYETNYRELQERLEAQGNSGNFVVMPLIPYGPLENAYPGEFFMPRSPDIGKGHWLGTDTQNRDVLARVVYGFRYAMIFAFGFMAGVYILGILLGCLMGYFGGGFDLAVQRLIEIWSNINFLYVVIIATSIIRPNLGLLLVITVAFSWTAMTYYMRTATYKEKARDYVAAAQVLGAGPGRVIFTHILPNTVSTIVTFIPFTVAGAITALTALDFLGFGLPPPTPSWGELLKQGTQTLKTAPWIVSSAFTAMVIVLTLVTFVGEAIREAVDPKQFTLYE
jgi:microcin C transport system permease protein